MLTFPDRASQLLLWLLQNNVDFRWQGEPVVTIIASE